MKKYIDMIREIEELPLSKLKELAKLLFGDNIVMVYNGIKDYGWCFECNKEVYTHNETEHYHDAKRKGIIGLVYFYVKDVREISGTGLATAITSGMKAIEKEAMQ